MNKTCARCEKTVYPTEELKCLDKVWHKGCFKCQECGMTLNMRTYKGYGKLPYCEAHVPKAKHTTMAETPELKRIAENTKIQSNVNYHAAFEKSKGKFTQVADDPETLRIKANTKIISNVAYHGELEKKAHMERQRQINENGELVDVPTPENYHQQIETYATEMLPTAPPNLPSKNHYHTPSGQFSQPSKQKYSDQYYRQYEDSYQYQKYDEYQNQNHQNHQQYSMQGHQPNPIQSHQQAMNQNHQAQIQSHQAQIQNHQAAIQSHQAPIQSHQAPIQSQQAPNQNHQPQIQSYQAPIQSHQAPIQSHQAPIQNHQAQMQNHQNQFAYGQYQQPNYGVGQQQKIGRIQDYDPLSDGPRSVPNTQRASATLIYNSTSDGKRGGHIVQQQQPRQIGRVADLDPLANEPRPASNHHNQRVYIAMYDYEANDSDEVSFREGDLISNVTSIDEGWMTGQVLRTGSTGMLPANYVELAPAGAFTN